MLWIGIFLVLFGLGCVIGACYALIRYGIPVFVKGFGQIFEGCREGIREGHENAERILAERQARQANQH